MTENNSLSTDKVIQTKPNNIVFRRILAVVLCTLIFFVYLVIGAGLGWRSGGGLIPFLILLGCISFTWKKVTGQKTDPKTTNEKPSITSNLKNSGGKLNYKKLSLVIIVIFFGIILSLLALSNDIAEELELPETNKEIGTYEVIDNLYRNHEYKFRIKFPEGWVQKSGDGERIVRKATKDTSQVNIAIQELPKFSAGYDYNITDVYELDEIRKMANDLIKSSYSGGKLVDIGETTIDNQPAYWFSIYVPYSTLGKNIEMIQKSYQLIKNNIFYTISISGSPDDYENNKDIMEKSVSTFVFESWK